jgi:predicted RNA-binding Zn-ribbon protein involved in translation (DUF1610 family)
MVRLIQKGDPAGSEQERPPLMSHRLTRTCDECGSPFYVSASYMASLCPECAHYLYDMPACAHVRLAGHCSTCGWDGTESRFVARLKGARRPGGRPSA